MMLYSFQTVCACAPLNFHKLVVATSMRVSWLKISPNGLRPTHSKTKTAVKVRKEEETAQGNKLDVTGGAVTIFNKKENCQ